MDKSGNRLSKADSIVSLSQWGWDKIGIIVASTFGGSLITALAAATEWISRYGPFAWGLIGLGTFLILMAALTAWTGAWSRAQLNRAFAEVAERVAERGSVNPLEARFYRQQIKLEDFLRPDATPVAGKVFEDCDLIGPMVVLLGGAFTYSNNENVFVEFVKVRDHIPMLPNKLILHDVIIRNCRIYSVVFLVPDAQVAMFHAGFAGDVPWLN